MLTIRNTILKMIKDKTLAIFKQKLCFQSFIFSLMDQNEFSIKLKAKLIFALI